MSGRFAEDEQTDDHGCLNTKQKQFLTVTFAEFCKFKCSCKNGRRYVAEDKPKDVL